jgi:hypothetical protein
MLHDITIAVDGDCRFRQKMSDGAATRLLMKAALMANDDDLEDD